MGNEILNENRSKLLFAAVALVVLAVAALCVHGAKFASTDSNNQAVQSALVELSYTQDAADDELARLESLASRGPLSDAVSGQLYCAMAEISYMNADDMTYNGYVARALYYLGLSNDSETRFYLINKYVGRLYANGCYESAAEILQEASETNNIDEFSAAMQASFHLTRADVAQMLGQDATNCLESARTAIAHISETGMRGLNQAKLDLLVARSCIDRGDFSQASSLMSSYSETDDFGLGKGQVYVVCDFQIPYYEIAAKLALHQQDFASASRYIDAYVAACERYDFRAMKLNLLQYATESSSSTQDDAPDVGSGSEATPGDAESSAEEARKDFARTYRDLKNATAQENLDEMANAYGMFLLADIDSTTETLADQAKHAENTQLGIMVGIAAAYALILLYCLGSVFMDYLGKDSLTRLDSRRRYERAKAACQSRRIPYCLLMLDIDDFKAVNDTFGHRRGDEVLRDIAVIMRRYVGRGIAAYRYGGEELCLVMRRISEQRAREIAEEIRASVEASVGGTAEVLGPSCAPEGKDSPAGADAGADADAGVGADAGASVGTGATGDAPTPATTPTPDTRTTSNAPKLVPAPGVRNMRVTVSGGLASSKQGEDVFQLADERLYEAKKQGKNRIC